MAPDKAPQSVQITSKGIKNSLKKYKPLNAIAEYVWNGFDAAASTVEVTIRENTFGEVEEIEVSDNGHGIERDALSAKFTPFFQSEKIYDPDSKHSAAHGKNGVGRLTFFTFAAYAEWTTVYRKDDKNLQYSITVHSNSLEEYNPSEPEEVDASTGTKVTLYNVHDKDISKEIITEYLALEFCWYLCLHKGQNYQVIINGAPLDYSFLINHAVENQFTYAVETDPQIATIFDVWFICWNEKLREYSKYYFIKTDGMELGKENTTLNNKGDKFYHSVFITSALFDNFDLDDESHNTTMFKGQKTKQSEEFQYIYNKVNQLLIDERRPFLKQHVAKVIEEWDIRAAFPSFDDKNSFDLYRKTEVESLITSIYIAQPKIFSSGLNKEQKKTFIRLLDLTMQSGEVSALYDIFQEILDMSSYEREELSEILKYTKMSNITRTIKLIKDRFQAVADLKALVFNKALHANEVHDLQKFIEKHYWLFGEEFALVTAAEPNFEEALRRYCDILHKEYEDKSVTHPDRLKQMDIFAVRQNIWSNRCDNIVIELKHPDILLGETQLSQVKKYMRVILDTPEFNDPNAFWKFYLIGNRFDTSGYIEGELESNKPHGETALVHAIPNRNAKIYVKTWSEVFNDFETNYNHITKSLEIERTRLQKDYQNAGEIVLAQESSTAVALEEHTVQS